MDLAQPFIAISSQGGCCLNLRLPPAENRLTVAIPAGVHSDH